MTSNAHSASSGSTCCSLIICIVLGSLLPAVESSNAKTCPNRLDIAIVIDTTSSLTAASFENVKTEVKGIVSGFTVGQSHTRLALVSISSQAQVVVNFDGVKSLADFNAAVDRLTFSTETAKLSMGVKTAKDSVLNTARGKRVLKMLILVKDRRISYSPVTNSAELSFLAAESQDVKSMGALVHAVGVGGLWMKQELDALFGTEYLLFKNRNKALESVKSFRNPACDADCTRQGAVSNKNGLCFENTKHQINGKVDLFNSPIGIGTCRTTIDRSFAVCNNPEKCDKTDSKLGSCGRDGKQIVENSQQSFNRKLQACVTTTNTKTIDCAEANKCTDQIADIIILLDKSGSLDNRHSAQMKAATETVVGSFHVGPNNVVVGIMKFGTEAEQIVRLGSITDKAALMRALRNMPSEIDGNDWTYTNKGIRQAGEDFTAYGRKDVPKFIFLLSDGGSTKPQETMKEIHKIRNMGVTVYAIGVGNVNPFEMEAMTAPESSTNYKFLKDFSELDPWIEGFTKKMCSQLKPPNPKLCDDSVVQQAVLGCMDGKQRVVKTEYKYSSTRRCIKTSQIVEYQNCRSKCVDPVDGSEYMEGESWTSLCHEFRCTIPSPKPMVPVSSKCLASDGSCKDVGSPPFRCLNDQDVETDDCRCLSVNGKVTTVIETE